MRLSSSSPQQWMCRGCSRTPGQQPSPKPPHLATTLHRGRNPLASPPAPAQADLLLTRLCGSATLNVATNVAECVIADGFVEHCRYLLNLGVRDAFSGLAPRLVMTSAMTSIQFVLYDSVRQALGVSSAPQPPRAVELPS